MSALSTEDAAAREQARRDALARMTTAEAWRRLLAYHDAELACPRWWDRPEKEREALARAADEARYALVEACRVPWGAECDRPIERTEEARR